MKYPTEDSRMAAQLFERGMYHETIALLINSSSNTDYDAEDVKEMILEFRNNQPTSENGKLYDAAAGFVFNPQKRRKAKRIFLSVVAAFAVIMIAIGFFVSWKPVLITVASLFGVILILFLIFFIMAKTGVLDKIIDR